MGNIPKVSVAFSNGNLLQNIAAIDGEAAFIGTGYTAGNLGKVFIINSLADAIRQGITAIAEPTAFRHLSEFYTELQGNQECFIFLVPNTVTMAQMLDVNAVDKASLLITTGAGKIGYLGVFRTPPVDYNGGADYIDADVDAAIIAGNGFITAQNNKNVFFTIQIEGRVILANETSNTVFAPNTAMANFCCAVLGGTLPDGSASIGVALGRKVKFPAHIKVGKVANGPLSIVALYIGTRRLELVTNLDALAGAGYLTFITYPNKAGFYFGIDFMANTGDYSIWARAAVMVAAAKVAVDVYINDLEGEVDLNDDGTIKELDAAHLENTVDAQEKFTLGDRISNFTALVDRASDIGASNTTKITLRVIPKGYNSFIMLDLGLTA